MFRTKVTVIVFLMLISPGITNLISKTSADETNEIPEWGVYVYMAGDNTLYEELDDDLNEMKMVGSNENLEIIAITDQVTNNDSHAYRIIKDNLEETSLEQINSTWENEIDMGNKNTLRDFMIWASNQYPAQNKILIIWNHGSGWEKVAEDKDNYLTVPDIRLALEEYRQITGDPPLKLIGFDACLMGMFEIVYELKNEAEMIHGSEAYEPLEGWTYNHLLYKLKPGLTNNQLANYVVNDYIESYRNGSVYTSYSVTASVVDTSKLEYLWNELNNFSMELKSVKPVYHNETILSREETQRYDQNPNYRDLYDLTVNVKNNIPVSDLHESANKLQETIETAVISEDHWQKPDKMQVDRAHGLTIYFPTEGPKARYDDLRINNNNWYDFIEIFPNNVVPNASFNKINAISLDTGTGYNDSIKINGTYTGNANIVKVRLLNNEGKVTNKLNENISNGNIPGIYLQPLKSGNYNLEIGLYNENGFLEDHYLMENLNVDLNLPDISVIKPKLLIVDSLGQTHEVYNLDENDQFSFTGEISNVGTVSANNVIVSVKSEEYNYTFNFPEIKANETKKWEVNNINNITQIGNYNFNISVSFDNAFEIDSSNNQILYTFNIFEKMSHDYLISTKNKNVIETMLNDNGEYEFSWLECYVSITNNKEQSWDVIEINANIPDNWEVQSSSFLHLTEINEIIIKIKPSLNTKVGEYTINLNITDRNNLSSGNGKITLNIPQYYGVGIKAKQIENYAEITVTNNGNGNDFFILSKDLEEGLILYLPETRFELEGFETKIIKTVGLETSNSKIYKADFTIQSESNANISASITLSIKKQNVTADSINQTWVIGIIGILGIIYLLYQRRIN